MRLSVVGGVTAVDSTIGLFGTVCRFSVALYVLNAFLLQCFFNTFVNGAGAHRIVKIYAVTKLFVKI